MLVAVGQEGSAGETRWKLVITARPLPVLVPLVTRYLYAHLCVRLQAPMVLALPSLLLMVIACLLCPGALLCSLVEEAAMQEAAAG